jgi:3-dehydroquinate synthase
MFDFVRDNHHAMVAKDMPVLLEGIRRSIAVKAGVVEKDEFETSGLRALLNFGHTFAHGLERYFNFENILHGEAVWWGMRCAIVCAKELRSIDCGLLPDFDAMTALMPRPALPEKPDAKRLYEMMFTDKKVVDGKLRLVLPVTPGVSEVRGDVPAEAMKAVLSEVFGG